MPHKPLLYQIRNRLLAGTVVSLTVALLSVLTLGKPTPFLSLLLVGIARFVYTLAIWCLYPVCTHYLSYHRLIQFFLFILVCIICILPLIPVNLWINEITDSTYPPFALGQSYYDNPIVYYLHFYVLRGIMMGIPVFIISYREDLVKEKQRIQLMNQQLESQNLKMQLEILRQQVNPHFLFNTLNSLRILIKNNPVEAELYTIELANVYRYFLKYHKQETVFLQEELDFIQSYLSLLKIRFGESLKVNVNIDQAYYKYSIVPLSLQILLENAVKHNSITAKNPLNIKIFVKEHNLLVFENNLQPRPTNDSESKFGLYHLNEQYRSYSGREILIDKTDKTFTVSLPLI